MKLSDLQTSDFNWFMKNFKQLYEEYGDVYLIIKNKEVLGFATSYASGVREAQKIAPLGSFIVQKVGPDESCFTVESN